MRVARIAVAATKLASAIGVDRVAERQAAVRGDLVEDGPACEGAVLGEAAA